MKRIPLLLAGLTLAAAPALAQESQSVSAALMDTDGNQVGSASLETTPSGLVHVTVEAEGLSEGVHGVHIHQTGDCGNGDFKAAGGHLASTMQHGIGVKGGPHPGDLPNAHVQSDGVLAMEAFKSGLKMKQVMDDDGSALVIHAGPDDYQSQPSGASGDRVVCGVFKAD